MSAQLHPGYKQTEAGVIPVDWETDTMLGVSRQIMDYRGRTPKKLGMDWGGGDIPALSAANVKMGFIDFDEECYFGSEPLYRCWMTRGDVEKGDILFTTEAPLGNVALVPDDRKYILSQRTILLQIVKQRISNRFLFQVMRSTGFQRMLADYSSGSTAKGIQRKKFEQLCVAVPELIEQEAIAEALSDADALIESLEQLLAKKRHLKQGTMQELLTGKKRLPGFSGEWVSCLLGDVIEGCSSGATPYRGRQDYYVGDVKWITSGELNYNVILDTIEHISDEAVQKTNLKVHPAGTFLMAITGLEAAGTRGACAFVGSPATTNQSCMAIYPSPALEVKYLYHYYVLRGDELAFRYCQGTKQQSYTAKLVKLLPIDLPPTVEEQAAIAGVLSDMDAELAELETQLTKTRTLKQGMMHKLLTGEIRLL